MCGSGYTNSKKAIGVLSGYMLAGMVNSGMFRIRTNAFGLDPASHQFCDTPGLHDTASWSKRRFRVEDFAYRSDAAFAEVMSETLQEGASLAEFVRMQTQIGVDKWSNQPGPDGPLMIGGIARAQIAVVTRFVVRMAGG